MACVFPKREPDITIAPNRQSTNKMPPALNDEQLAKLIVQKESARVEFKESLRGNAPIGVREAICAFANDLPRFDLPGIVVIGVDDEGIPVGTPVTDEMLRSLTDIRSDATILPPPVLLVEKRLFRGCEVAVVTVQPTDSPPVRYKGTIHVRSGPRRGIATAQEERILNERRRYGDRPFDITPLLGTSINDLNRSLFEQDYLPNAVDPELIEANERTYPERLAATKMIASLEDDRSTALGQLVLGFRPRDFIPGAYVQFLRIAGKELSDPIIDELVIDGRVTALASRLEDKLRAHIIRRIEVVNRARETRIESYPYEALVQFVRNALMHRDYEHTNAPVRVTWFDDRIEILNPGGPFGSVAADNFAQPGVTDYRNPNLAESMRVLGLVQRFGIGIPLARKLLREAGHPQPEFAVSPTHVQVTVRAVSHTVSG